MSSKSLRGVLGIIAMVLAIAVLVVIAVYAFAFILLGPMMTAP